jgi:hypothetical protein
VDVYFPVQIGQQTRLTQTGNIIRLDAQLPGAVKLGRTFRSFLLAVLGGDRSLPHTWRLVLEVKHGRPLLLRAVVCERCDHVLTDKTARSPFCQLSLIHTSGYY